MISLFCSPLVTQRVNFNEWFTESYLNCIESELVLIVVISPALSSIRQTFQKSTQK